MKTIIQSLLRRALESLAGDTIPEDAVPDHLPIERARDPRFGDFASNVALILAKTARCNPRELAQRIADAIPASDAVTGVEIAGPGFINFRMSPAAFQEQLAEILDRGSAYGRVDIGAGRKIIVEFVSANPTGPLHVGHGRNAAFGDSIANLLDAAGYSVHREYYINDAGRQADILGISVWCRYLERRGARIGVPSRGYPGDYVSDIAAQLEADHGDAYERPVDELLQLMDDADSDKETQEANMTALIATARSLLGEERFEALVSEAVQAQLARIKDTLARFNVRHDEWYSEKGLVAKGEVEIALERLQAADAIYDQGGARWLKTEAMGDEKDRVLVRADGSYTYFATDVAYHVDKLDRDFEIMIDVWGADHHGYIARVRAAIQALTGHGERFEAPLIQFVTLASGKMGKRSGNFVTLDDLIDEVGADATRYFYLSRSNDQHLEFDLELAKSRSNENPVYYIQYAHARICSVLSQLEEKGLEHDAAAGRAAVARLEEEHELNLLGTLSRFPEVVEVGAEKRAPHTLAHYLREVANDLHTYYNAHQFLVDDAELRAARLNLCLATRQVLRNGLALLGVSAPESM